MVINPMKGFLFAAGAAAAIVAIAWYAGGLDPYLPGEPPVIAAVPPAGSPKDERVGEPAALEAPVEAPAEAEPAPEVVPPSFDIVRVEPNGSIVIAGKAAGDATVEILAGSQVIATAKAGPDGDFAAVLDEPLDPGDYQIVLRSTTADNVVAASPETAIVSIPEQPDGQVLALVEQPGEPSKLITVPEAEEPAPAAEPDAAPAADGGDVETAAAEPDAPVEPAAPDAAPEPEAQTGTAETASGTAPVETPPSTTGEEVAAAPDASEAPQTPQADAEAPAAAAPSSPADEPEQNGTEMAAVAPDAAETPAAPASPSELPEVAVEAVEIEGLQIFVAGRAKPGAMVRVYANDMLLGQSRATERGRFLVETERELPVGDYIIRADVLSGNGADVIARAAVPFEREAGESIAAVAPPATAPVAPEAEPAPDERQQAAAPSAPPAGVETSSSPPAAEAGPEPAAPEIAAADPAGESDDPGPAESEIAAAPADEPAAPAPAEEPSESATAPADSAPVDSDAAVADARPAPGAASPEATADAPVTPAEDDTDSAAATPSEAETSPPVVAEEPSAPAEPAQTPEIALEEPAVPAEDDAADTADASPDAPAQPAEQPETAQDEAAEPAPEEQVAAAEPSAPPAADGIPTVTAPKLESVPSAVIIRRGDNLWRISRRIYGRGIRYTTIYLANEEQIQDPDLIFPGQVFSVPEKTEEGEAADMEAIRERFSGDAGREIQ